MSLRPTIEFSFLLLCCLPASASTAELRPLVIAHRGASGYLPEHTLAAKAMAHAMRADYLEQDVVLTKDGRPIVLHDIHLDAVTDVAKVYPRRARTDGRFYAIDFTLREIKRLTVHERVDPQTQQAIYKQRFPTGKSSFQISTLAEEIEMIQGLNQSTRRRVGIYPEIKSPGWHRRQGHDISQTVLQVLAKYGFRERSDLAYLQCFDGDELQRIRNQLGSRLKLIQLLRDECGDDSYSPDGLRRIAGYADGIGPPLSCVIVAQPMGSYEISSTVSLAHESGLSVHVYTLRADTLPNYAASFDELLDLVIRHAKVDGLFTDFPDQAVTTRGRLAR